MATKAKAVAAERETPAAATQTGGDKAAESKYTVSELAEHSRQLFKCPPYVVRSALDANREYTKAQATAAVTAFMKKEVKS